MIYITGDTHIPIDIKKLGSRRFVQQKELSKKDFVIICGDFGGVFFGDREELYWRKWLESKSFTTLFVDGNHENFDMLAQFPTVELCGGRAHRIGDSIFHLMRGEVYEIDGRRIFTMGGGESHDRHCRTEGENWWKEELPSAEQYSAALEKLEGCGWCVDTVITHSAPSTLQKRIAAQYGQNALTEFLQGVMDRLQYKSWFFGHYHRDIQIDEKHRAIYNDIIKL